MGGVKAAKNVSKTRVHDYLYDSSFIVSGARDYARTAIRAAMSSAQIMVQPLFHNMFSVTNRRPSIQVVYHMNCRLPDHLDTSYGAYLDRSQEAKKAELPDLDGKDRYKFLTRPKTILPLNRAEPDFHPPTPRVIPTGPSKPRNRGMQSVYRESSAQTIPWQPDGKIAEDCTTTPEVLYLDKLLWGPGKPYRLGDLPADFHTTQIINKMRHARRWSEVVEKGEFPRWMKRRDSIIEDIETKDWIFREAEIDELQDIRLELLHRLQMAQRQKQVTRSSRKLEKLWNTKKQEMERKIDKIRKTRDREHRKLLTQHEAGGGAGMASRLRAARGHGCMILAATDPTSDLHAPLLRHGYQARRRHAEIIYDPSLLSVEDHDAIAEPPAWLETCHNVEKTCSGHHLPQDKTKLCERETKWSEQFLENLHNDLKKARLGAALMSAGPLHVLKPRKAVVIPRPATPVVECVEDSEETDHQCALMIQRLIRGRAVQYLMYEGRTRASELTEELKTTHGLQKEDKIRIAREESKAREFNARRNETELREDAISALVDELCGGAVSAALDFLEKELRRLKEERRQHAFILIALREKTMREAAEAGKRQKEEHRRREHDEMFRHVLGTTQGTVEAYLKQIINEGVELTAEIEAVKAAEAQADKIDLANTENSSLSTAEQSEMVAELVQQFLLPHAHKTAARHKIEMQQKARLEAARKTIFGILDDAEIKEEICNRCGRALGDLCRCGTCPLRIEPTETIYREDKRWRFTRTHYEPEEKTTEDMYPMAHEARYLLDALVNDVVSTTRRTHNEACVIRHDVRFDIAQKVETHLEAKDLVNMMVDAATDKIPQLPKYVDYYHIMKRVIPDAMEGTQTQTKPPSCPKKLPSQFRREALEASFLLDPTCYCIDRSPASPEQDQQDPEEKEIKSNEDKTRPSLLPSALRVLEDMKRCKCDVSSVEDTTKEGVVSEGSVTSTHFSSSGYTDNDDF